jgi:hypothetical protein
MFNRGCQYITDAEFGSDLIAFTQPLEASQGEYANPAQLGQRTIGQFFFVHTSETGGYQENHPQRSYEFLHSTFGEYLIAYHLVELLKDAAPAPRYSRRGVNDIDDAQLYALLSHQPLSIRRSVLSFLREISRSSPKDSLNEIHKTLGALTVSFRRRESTGRLDVYRPTQTDRVRELATYSANLVLLKVFLSWPSELVEIQAILGKGGKGRAEWRDLVRLWHAGLDPSAWESVVDTLIVEDFGVAPRVKSSQLFSPHFRDLGYAQLSAEEQLELKLRLGMAAGGQLYLTTEDKFIHQLYSYLVFALVHGLPGLDFEQSLDHMLATMSPLPQLANENDPVGLLPKLIVRYLGRHAWELSYNRVHSLVSTLSESMFDAPVKADGTPTCPELAIVVAAHPKLLADFPGLRRASLYLDSDSECWVWMVFAVGEEKADALHRPLLASLRESVQMHLYEGSVAIDYKMICEFFRTGSH